MVAPEPPHPYPRPVDPPAVHGISATELAAALGGERPPLLLDVRPAAERRYARLPGDRHVPLAELAGRLGELPRDRPIVTYCQFGARARQAAELLAREGLPDVRPLEGGLDDYARTVDPSVGRYSAPSGAGPLVLKQLPRVETGCLSYLLADPVGGRAVLLDPGISPEPYLAELESHRWSLAAIVETHTHADHLAGHQALHQRTGAPIYVSRRSPAQYPHRTLSDGEAIPLGDAEIVVLETPGHTRDHLSLRVRDTVFTGDTLLIGSCGRTDLGDGSPELLWESLTEKLLRLPDETEVLPAHYGRRHALPERYVTSLGFEKATNEALRQGSLDAFRTYMTDGWPPKPADFDAIVAANLRA